MAKDSIEISTEGLKKGVGNVVAFFKNKKVQNILVIILLLSIIFVGVSIRTQNLNLLVDQTTGKHIPLALDPFYFLRVTETIAEQGGLPEFDEMRFHPTEGTSWTKEIWPYYTNPIYKIAKLFNPEVTLQFTAVIFPVIFFVLGIIAFFFLVFFLTGSRVAGISASAFLTVLPPYLYRSTAGFYDHEINGMFVFFLTLIAFTFALKFLDKLNSSNRKNLYKSISFGLLVGFFSIFTMVNWGGISNFLFMIIPLSFLLFWLIKSKNLEENKKKLLGYFSFYITFFVSTIIFGLVFGFDFSAILNRVALSTSSAINSLVLLFIISDFLIIRYGKLVKPLKNRIKENRILYSSGLVIVLGIILLTIFKGNPFSFIFDILERILRPFGTGRVGLTVAENRQPFLNDWISQTGDIFYWLFVGGLIAIGTTISKTFKSNKNKYLFIFFWIFLLAGILYSRISSGSILDGNSFISKLFYFGSVFLFAWICIKIYNDPKETLRIKPELLIIFSWMIFMLIGTRGAIRLFFVITPFTCLSAGILISSLGKSYMKKSSEKEGDEGSLSKMFVSLLFVIVIVVSILSLNNLASISTVQASQTGPSADGQWQQAMDWVRGNTPEDSVFSHWWDYGYWVQTLGGRRTLADGGQFQRGYGNHLLGRYLLTESNPEATLSFLKTNQVSHLLIDPSDLGKYPAYSKIGSDNNWDRFSAVSAIPEDLNQRQSSGDMTARIYPGGLGVEDDIIYTENGEEIFLPGARFDDIGNPNYRSFFGGAIIETNENSGSSLGLEQPTGLFLYNGQRYDLPIRYLYYNGELLDFGSGINSTLMVIPSISQSSQGSLQINNFGAVIYMSSRVKDSVFAQLYLMGDPEDKYPTISLVHRQYGPVLNSLRAQGLDLGDFVYYQGFRGPIKIWEIDYPGNVNENEEFLRRRGEYAAFDGLDFIR